MKSTANETHEVAADTTANDTDLKLETVDEQEPEKLISPKESPVPPAPSAARLAPTLGRFGRLRNAYLQNKRFTIPATILTVVALLLLIPATRYPLLGLVVKKDFVVLVLDATSKKPITKAQVQIGSVVIQTDASGRAMVRSKVGQQSLRVTKKYYKSVTTAVLVPLHQQSAFKTFVTATGRQVPVIVTNKITGKPVSGVLLAVADTEVKTDKDGKATIVLPADKPTAVATLSSDGFNNTTSMVQVTEQTVPQNSFQIVPAGKLYFLSKLSGKIDVVKTNLDGTERQTVLAGTGKENATDTILLAARDWKYLALKSQRDGGDNAKLFVLDTSTDKVTTLDEGKAYFEAIGWADHHFVYKVGRQGLENWQPKAQALKSYDAETNKLAVITETDAEGTGAYDYAFNTLGTVYLLNNEIVYNKNWNASYYGSHLMVSK